MRCVGKIVQPTLETAAGHERCRKLARERLRVTASATIVVSLTAAWTATVATPAHHGARSVAGLGRLTTGRRAWPPRWWRSRRNLSGHGGQRPARSAGRTRTRRRPGWRPPPSGSLPSRPDGFADRPREGIERGDVWYNYPYTASGGARSQPIEPGPTLRVFVGDGVLEVPLARGPTTIGGWEREATPRGWCCSSTRGPTANPGLGPSPWLLLEGRLPHRSPFAAAPPTHRTPLGPQGRCRAGARAPAGRRGPQLLRASWPGPPRRRQRSPSRRDW
jgi:hypothetical protein